MFGWVSQFSARLFGKEAEKTRVPYAPSLMGQQVEIHSLTSRKDLNGSFGKVDRYIEESGRYIIRVGDEEIALEADNVRRA